MEATAAKPATAASQPETPEVPFRPQPSSIEETGIDVAQLIELTVKTLYQGGRTSGRDVSERLALPFSGVVERVLEFLKREKFIEVVGTGGGLTEQQYQYALTEKGQEKALEALERNRYVGPAPVPFQQYIEVARAQSIRHQRVDASIVDAALGDLVLTRTTRGLVGPAVNSGRSLLLYGEPGNGKSSIAKAIRAMLHGEVLIPHAVDIGNQTIRVYDTRVHQQTPRALMERRLQDNAHRPERRMDQRWVVAQRPLIIVGGELTLADLELKYSPQSHFYIAPVQMKANCGVLVIDDLGRQLVQPRELLNRWIMPMESRIDYLSLLSGETLEMPFELLLVFSTNIEPTQLGDEAFFRRIRHKIEVTDPDEAGFLRILRHTCERHEVPYTEVAGRYLVDRYYRPKNRPFRGVHPRDIVDLLLDISSYQGLKPEFTQEWIDLACASYFIEEHKPAAA